MKNANKIAGEGGRHQPPLPNTHTPRNANKVSDEGGQNNQNLEERRQRTDGGGSQTVSRKARGGAAKEGHGSGNKSGGSGKKGDERNDE